VSLEALGRIHEGKGEFLYFEATQPGAETASLLPGMVQAALDALPIPKRMRWGASEAQFVAPRALGRAATGCCSPACPHP